MRPVIGDRVECTGQAAARLTPHSAEAYDFCFPKTTHGIYLFSTFA
jgi:hypothetical protein